MKKYISYKKANSILESIKKNNGYKDGNLLEIEIKELVDIGFIEIVNSDILINDFNSCKITNEGEKFLNSYKGYSKIEYFFQDFPFLQGIILGFIGGVIFGNIGKIVELLFKLVKNYG